MKITLKKTDFEHIPDKSGYNHNFYRHKELKYEIYEECDEIYESFDFHLIDQDKKVYLGKEYDSLDPDYKDDVSEIEFEFKS